MKKLLFISTLVIAGYIVSFAQTPADIYSSFATEPKAQTVSIGDLSINLGDKYDESVKSINSIKVLTLSDCTQSVKDEFSKRVNKLAADDYETILRVNKDNGVVRLLAKVNGDTVNELLVIVTGESPVLVDLKGSISKSKLMSSLEKSNGSYFDQIAL